MSTAWSSATRRTRRWARRPRPPSARFCEPVYIGMTATDQLLQKHVGDVFPAEVADFPLAEAVRRGVVAPLRCVRVRPIASLRNVEIVGGDFDQSQLAAALDLDPLNLAAADLYQSRFGDTPGIVYAAGVDHAERVAAAMRAIGMAAAAVSGRTPPRELAETLAAYERGEINVLVNAQILAEGWNAPRATVCMHLAPTASRRVYQQRVGRIMRLHRRKEAGIVVDFAEAGAPHTERTVTLHSLLGVDAYRPGGLVTPPPPRRRRRRRAGPADRQGSVLDRAGLGRSRAADRGHRQPVEAGRRLQAAARRAAGMGGGRGPLASPPADVQQLAERITALAARGARALPLHLRRREPAPPAAPDRARRPGVAAARARPPSRWPAGWSRPRRPGSRIAGRAPGCCCWRWATAASRRPADRIVTWTWQLARAARDHQYRYAGSHVQDGRSLLGALAAAPAPRPPTPRRRCGWPRSPGTRRWRRAPPSWPSPRRAAASTAERMIEVARRELSAEPLRLAAALGSNIPAPMPRTKASQAGQAQGGGERGQTVSFNGAVVGSTPPAVPLVSGRAGG